MSTIPAHLQDAKDLLSESGFATNDIWYHGTSSALLESIRSQGLKRSGDKALKQSAKKTMAQPAYYSLAAAAITLRTWHKSTKATVCNCQRLIQSRRIV